MAWVCLVISTSLFRPISASARETSIDTSAYRPDCGIAVTRTDNGLSLDWPINDAEHGRLILDLRADRPLVASLAIAPDAQAEATMLLKGVEPVTFLTVGTRSAPEGRPPTMSVFNTFFDSPAQRPHQIYKASRNTAHATVRSHGHRATVALDGLTAGPFKGSLEITLYAGTRLVHVEAVLRTEEDRRAFLYDAGLAGDSPGWRRFVWIDTEGKPRREEPSADAADRAIAVRHRTLIAETEQGSVACFPPPHQYFSPRDLTDNLRTTWFGRGHRGLEERSGFGIRQSETGGGNFVPWFNAPPGTEQRLGVFYLLSRGNADEALKETLRFTHGDRYPDLPGYRTFTSHWHMAIAMAALDEKKKGTTRTTPDFVRMFKDMNVNMVHLAEFHGDGHPRDSGPVRLAELDAMFDECRRLSDDELLFLPGEEANVHLGLPAPGRDAGHWLYLFPKPVYWVMKRAAGEPFAQEDPKRGTIYRVGDRADMLRLLKQEHGLAWTAHPRIKASSWTPDIYRSEDFYLSDVWLGASWKAMPADLSRPKLGERSLDLLDDVANWGQHKYVLGEVDVFKIDHTHELYGHMNVNYVRLDRAPRFGDDWTPLLYALRAGQFFVSTGEVLLREFTVGGKSSGETLSLASSERPELRLALEWTFPPRFVEIVSGDGTKVFRERVDLSEAGPFGHQTLSLRPDLSGRRWVRAEAWDIAANGAFTEPVWLGIASGQ